MGNANNREEFSRVLRGDEAAWAKTIKMLEEQKAYANERGFEQTGCIGLNNAFDTKIDPRFGTGLTVCPCRTMSREWVYTLTNNKQT